MTKAVGDLITQEEIVSAIAGLPEEALGEICEFIAFLQFKARARVRQQFEGRRLCRDLPTLNETELAKAGEDVVASLSEREPA